MPSGVNAKNPVTAQAEAHRLGPIVGVCVCVLVGLTTLQYMPLGSD